MPKKVATNPWALYEFSKVEWAVVRQTWSFLVNDDRVITGDSNCMIANFQELLKELRSSDSDLAQQLVKGLPSGTKKYKAIHNFVKRKTASEEDTNKTVSSQQSQILERPEINDTQLFSQPPGIQISSFHSPILQTTLPGSSLVDDVVETGNPAQKTE